jgi:hypothetical protein
MKRIQIFAILIGLLAVIAMGYQDAQGGQNKKNKKTFTDSFMFDQCGGFSTEGINPFFVLTPGYQLVLGGEDNGEIINLTITVLDQTKTITGVDLGGGVIADVETRVVEEREWVGNLLIEVSHNYFAICNRTNDAVYFGEDVFICEDGLDENANGFTCNGGEPSHEGAWLAGQPAGQADEAKPGIIMPGTVLLGARYMQEIAPGVALDRAEITSLNETVETDAGTFTNCLETFETTPLEKKSKDFKLYCPGIGLVQDADLLLISFGP